MFKVGLSVRRGTLVRGSERRLALKCGTAPVCPFVDALAVVGPAGCQFPIRVLRVIRGCSAVRFCANLRNLRIKNT